MLLFLKIISSSLMIILITEIAKKNHSLAGMIAVLPVNILLSLLWIYIENKNLNILTGFVHSALVGLVPTIFFLITIIYFLSKNINLGLSVFISLLILGILVLVQQKIINCI